MLLNNEVAIARTSATAVALTATLWVAAASWLVRSRSLSPCGRR